MDQLENSLVEHARSVRLSILDMVSSSGSSHVGSAFSIVDILVSLYFDVLKVNPQDPSWSARDRLLLSKGHGGAALYAVLAHRGFANVSVLNDFAQVNSSMAGHIVKGSIPGVETTAGSLGHGLPMGVGMAIAIKKTQPNARVFVIVGDGECNEGTTWEAALVASHFKLDNFVVIVDRNGQQSMGESRVIMDMDPFADKWKSFGWHVEQCSGHDFPLLKKSLSHKETDRPMVVIADTMKGKGVSYMEADPLTWHYKTPKDELLKQARKELSAHA